MRPSLHAILAHARDVPAVERARLAAELRASHLAGGVLVETCHRVELYTSTLPAAPPGLPEGTHFLDGSNVVRHLIRLAVGTESAVVAEDQLLHQLRQAVSGARRNGPLAPDLDRLFDSALRAGRRARSWLPARRPSLAEAAFDRVARTGGSAVSPVLVVGAGEMARRAATALARRGAMFSISSRTPERARALADEVGGSAVDFDPGPPVIREAAGIFIALGGNWPIADASAAALVASGCWVVDLSAPGALAERVARALGSRLLTIDDLADDVGPEPSAQLVERLDALVEETVADFDAWLSREQQRAAAEALTDKAQAVRSAELDALWRRMPELEPDAREEVERMARHLTERLLRDPLERLSDDRDGRHAVAARELFRL